MQERLIAFFATREAAEEAASALRRGHAPEAEVQILHADEGVSFAPKDSKSAKRRRETPDFMEKVRGFLAEVGLMDARRAMSVDDTGRSCFEEGLCRGGVVLRVDVDADQAQETMNLLARHEAIDVTEYATGWAGRTRTRKRETVGQDAEAPPAPAAARVRVPRTDSAAAGSTRKRTTKKVAADTTAGGNLAGTESAGALGPEERERMIAEQAYLLAEQRGFAGDLAMEDWLEAERIVDARLTAGSDDNDGVAS